MPAGLHLHNTSARPAAVGWVARSLSVDGSSGGVLARKMSAKCHETANKCHCAQSLFAQFRAGFR